MRPNIVLLLVDQMRRDCMGAMGHPVVETPTLDTMRRHGALFTRAYSAVPSCIAARAAILTGLSQGRHGRVGYRDGVPWRYDVTLPGEFARAGYQTQCVGKMHVYPERNLCGFHHVMLHDGYLHFARDLKKEARRGFDHTDDYLHWLKQQKGVDADLTALGLECNSWVARPWALPEALHPTNWCASEAIDFLRRRDPDRPFFLTASFVRPHSPLDPPPFYFDMYNSRPDALPNPPVGDWADVYPDSACFDLDTKEGVLPGPAQKRAQAAYYGHITHIDHQINRMLMAFNEYGVLRDTVFLFASDHGDLLGDHHLFRKALPYEGSAGVPMLLYDPGNLLNLPANQTVDALCELRDILPTLLDAAGLPIPETVDGQSLLPHARGEEAPRRRWLHGEHAFGERSNQYIVTEKDKYVWFPITGQEQYFDLQNDPNELHNAIADDKHQARIEQLRQAMAETLTGREEGFVRDGRLTRVAQTRDVLSFLTEK